MAFFWSIWRYFGEAPKTNGYFFGDFSWRFFGGLLGTLLVRAKTRIQDGGIDGDPGGGFAMEMSTERPQKHIETISIFFTSHVQYFL